MTTRQGVPRLANTAENTSIVGVAIVNLMVVNFPVGWEKIPDPVDNPWVEIIKPIDISDL